MSFQDLYGNDGKGSHFDIITARKVETMRTKTKTKNRMSKRDEEEFPQPVNAALLKSMNNNRKQKKEGVIDGQVLQVLKAVRKYRRKQGEKLGKKMTEEF